jgi:predicted phage terminase large subunit-like protein
MKTTQLDQNLIQQIVNDRKVRTAATFESHYWFFNIYFSHYVKYPTAQFQKEIFDLTEQEEIKNVVIVAFRGSAKSTIMTLSYPIWAILGKQQKKFIILLGQTQSKARQYLLNIKRELESNEILRNDLGPFKEETDEWGSLSLVIPKYGAKITTASIDQSIRGLRHGPNRPDLIICDDVEDLDSVKTRDGRNKIYNWLTGDVIPAGDHNTRLIVIGNLLHEDSLLMRLKQNIEENIFDGVFRSYPLVTDDDQILWPGKFSSRAVIEAVKRSLGNEIAWQREFLLRIVPDTDQVVHPEWIHRYTTMPGHEKLLYTATGIDLAISQKDTADFTAMVSARVYSVDNAIKIYILPNPINERMTFPETVERIKYVRDSISSGYGTRLFVEKVGYQEALVQQLNKNGIRAEGVSVMGQDKRTRLALTTAKIQNGDILFPEKGADILIQQLLGFGTEKNDDLVDAFSLLILKIITTRHFVPSVDSF